MMMAEVEGSGDGEVEVERRQMWQCMVALHWLLWTKQALQCTNIKHCLEFLIAAPNVDL